MLHLSHCSVDLDRGQVTRADGSELRLTSKEFELLAYLVEHPSRAIERAELLHEVWGYRALSRTVDTAVKTLRKKIERDPSAPEHLLTVHGVGYRFAPGPAKAAPTHALFGRQRELAAIGDGFRAHRLVTLTGPGGVGKTRLARAVLSARTAGGAAVVGLADLASARTAEDVARALALSLQVRPEPSLSDEALLDGLVADLARRGPCLWALDNAEQVLDAVRAAVRPLLVGAPDAQILVTSRQALGLEGEVRLPLVGLDPAAAAALFRARAAERGVRVDEDPAVEPLVASLDGLPLAIELAAARSDLMSPSALCESLRDSLEALSRRGEPGRHQTMHAAIDWGWRLMRPTEQADLASLCVAAGPVDLAASAALLGGTGAQVLDRLQTLVDSSMIRSADRGGARAFEAWQPVRSFVRAQSGLEATRDEARARHLEHFAALGDELGARTGSDPQAMGALEEILPELEQILGQIPESDPRATRAAIAVWNHRMLTGPMPSLLRAADRAVRTAEASASDALGRTLLMRAWTLLQLSRIDGAERDLERAAPLVDGTPGDLSDHTRMLARVHLARGEHERARQALSPALALASRVHRGTALAFRGHLAWLGGAPGAAREDLEQAAELLRDQDGPWHLAEALGNLASVRRDLGLPCWEVATEVLQIGRALEEPWTTSRGLYHLAAAHLDAGELDAAQRRAIEAHPLAQGLGDPDAARSAALQLAEIAVHRSALDEAAAWLDRAEAIRGSAGGSPDTAGHLARGRVHLALGRPHEGLRAFRRAFEAGPLARARTGPWMVGAQRILDRESADPALEAELERSPLPASRAILAVFRGRPVDRVPGWADLPDGLPAEVRLAERIARRPGRL